MNALTIRLNDTIFDEIKIRAKKLNISRSEYIRKSIENMNTKLKQEERRSKILNASKLIKKDSMNVNSDFSKVECDPKI